MESAYVFSPAERIFRILKSFRWKNKGYSIIHLEESTNTLLLAKNKLLFNKSTFEIKVTPSRENVSSISVKQIMPENPLNDTEKKLISEILKLF